MRKLYLGLIFLLCFSMLFSGNERANAEDADSPHTIKVMSFNIAHGRGIDNDKVDLERIADVIRESGADVVGLQEVDRYYGDRSNYEDQLRVLAELLEDEGFIDYKYGANLDLEPHEGYESRQYGTGILSKYPIEEAENVLLNSYGREQRGVLKATIDVNGISMNIYNTHLALPDEDRLGQAEEIVEMMNAFPGPKILMGDLNTEPDTESLNYLLNYGEINDSFADIENAFTFRADDPIKRIDFLLTSPLITFDNQQVINTLASDHLPIVIDAKLYEEGMIEVTVHDEDNTDILLENVVFELRDTNNNVVNSNVTTDQNGQAFIEDLKPSDYYLIEMDPGIKDYELNAESIPVTIGKGEIQKITVTKELTRGAVEVSSVDLDNNDVQLTGGKYEVQTEDEETLDTNLKPDEDGKLLIKGLKPGNYIITQVEAPENYELNKKPIEFTIDKGQTEIPAISFQNEVIKSSAELILIDSNTSKPVSGGVFTLLDANKNELQTDLTVASSGKLIVGDLKPGSYQLIANKTPEGYEKIKDPIEFTIEYNAEEAVVKMLGIKPKADKPKDPKPENPSLDDSDLKSEIDKIKGEGLKEKEYTEKSWENFINALKEANVLIDHLDITQNEIDKTLLNLKTSRANLDPISKNDSNDNSNNDVDKDSNNIIDQNDSTNNHKDHSGSNHFDNNHKGYGEKLPETATSMFNVIISGFAILLIASIIFIINNRNKRIN